MSSTAESFEHPVTNRAGTLVRAGHDSASQPRHVFGGLRIDAKVRPEDTGGGLYVIEHIDEGRGGPPRHVHHAQDEWFYVLEGAYRIDLGEERFDLGPGDSILAPRRVPHVWAHVGEGAGRLILAFQPAGQMASFLGALSEMGSAPAPEVMAALFAAHGMTMLGPPLPTVEAPPQATSAPPALTTGVRRTTVRRTGDAAPPSSRTLDGA